MIKKMLPVVLAAVLFALSGCQSSSNENGREGNGKLKIVTTFYPMYDFAKNIAGNNASVKILIPAGVEPHDWEPSTKDLIDIQNADVFIYNGASMENWVNKVLQSINQKNLTVIEASKGLPLADGKGEGDSNVQSLDPHVWLDPALAKKEAENIYRGLVKKDPAHKKDYEKNYLAFSKKLNVLDANFKKTAKHAKRKEFVTQHTAFSYLAKQYGLKQIAVAGLSPDQEPSLKGLEEIANEVQKRHIKTVFFETLTSPKVAHTLAKEVHAKTDVLNPLEGLTDKEQKQGLDYIAVMEKNRKALEHALNE
ncbi:metal ABC transporter substrate-binding protein [Bacillus sp. MUM 13]|uniref:metal ABC transporter substrate-binding protein n=1 Tax=Bacillus sp. MUM 13 TaxID=1678001 RepID=UPI000A5CCA39|nr:metal ABC transporter substrate-binding protein [Bacillus sp. MUM 13]